MRYIYSIILLASNIFMAVDAAEVQLDPRPMETPIDLRRIIHQVAPDQLITALRDTLRGEADRFIEHENFSSEAFRIRSMENWQERCRYLKAAIELGDPEARTVYDREVGSKQYFLENYDCLIAGYEETYDPRMVLAFYWEQVAQEIPSERGRLDEAYAQQRAIRFGRR